MFTKRCFVLVAVALLITVTEQVNSNIFVDKSTVKCMDDISDGKSTADFKWRPKSLPQNEPSIPVMIQRKCSTKNLVVKVGVIDDASVVSPDEDALLVIDKIENELIGGKLKSRLAYPLVLKVSQLTPSILMYPIKFLYRVNAQPYEEVISLKSSKDYVGCYFGPGASKPTCGSTHGGFCCSCGSNRGNKCSKPFSEVSEVLQSSAHCLRFSPFWYGVYSLEKPQIYHQVNLQVFKNEELENGTVLWKRMFPGKGVTLSTQKSSLSLNSINLAFHDAEEASTPETVNSYLDISSSRLLVPLPNPVSVPEGSSLPEDTLSSLNHPSLEKGSKVEDALLILSKSLLAPEGLECNRVGASYSAFTQQSDSCNLPRNSCLTNQPLDLWKSRKHNVNSYGPLVKMTSPVKFTPGGKNGALLMENRNNGKKSYVVDLEISDWNDMNLLSRGYNPILEFVLTDTSWKSGAKVTVQLINSERIASQFKVQLKNCPGGLAGESEMKWVRPLASETFIIDLERARGINQTEECFVVVLNEIQETVGGRDVKFMDGDTCICSGRCKCVCAKEGMSCKGLEWEGLVAAGMEDWDEEVRDSYGTYGNSTFTDAEILSLDETVTRWWYWLIVILGFPLLAALFIGTLFWSFWKWRKKSNTDLGSSGSTSSFREGDKRHFSIADGDESGNEPSGGLSELSKATSKGMSILWGNTPSKNKTSSSKEILPRESKPESQNPSRVPSKIPSQNGGSGDALLAFKSLESFHKRRDAVPDVPTEPLQSIYSKTSSLVPIPSVGMRSSNRMDSLVMSEHKPSDISLSLVKTESALARVEPSRRIESASLGKIDSNTTGIDSNTSNASRRIESNTSQTGRVDSATLETVSVHQKNPTSSSSEDDNREIGGDQFTEDLLDGKKGLRLESHRRYGSWHRKGATASKSIIELCELTSSESRFSINGRPNPHFNYD